MTREEQELRALCKLAGYTVQDELKVSVAVNFNNGLMRMFSTSARSRDEAVQDALTFIKNKLGELQ